MRKIILIASAAAQATAEGKKSSLFGSTGYAISGTFNRLFKAFGGL